MSRPYRTFTREVAYWCPLFEAVLLARTTQRTVGLSKASALQGQPYIVAMYGMFPKTPIADNLVTGMAWFPARG